MRNRLLRASATKSTLNIAARRPSDYLVGVSLRARRQISPGGPSETAAAQRDGSTAASPRTGWWWVGEEPAQPPGTGYVRGGRGRGSATDMGGGGEASGEQRR